ncbi:YbaB/EbfC family nucleoid-associated protein [Saccharopolyspora sp. NPDC003752]
MSSPLFNEMETALQELRAQQDRIREATEQAEKETTTATSKDRMISATVDHRQRLVGLKFTGTRYRNMAPAELASRITEVVLQAQEEATGKSMAVFTQFMPSGFGGGLTDVLNGEIDLDRMFDDAVREAEAADAEMKGADAKGEDGNG